MREYGFCMHLREGGDDVLIRIKAVPSASRDAIVGVLGDRLKIRVSAPPQGGRANRAICALIAEALGVRAQVVTIEAGAASPQKVVRVSGTTAEVVEAALKLTADS